MQTQTLPPSALAVLSGIQINETTKPEVSEKSGSAPSLKERILVGFDVAKSYAATIQDPETRDKLVGKLSKSGVSGSFVKGVFGANEVAALLDRVTNWTEVVANLKDDKIIVLEGELPPDVEAVTAYASVREIAKYYGAAGVATITPKIGYQKDDEFYFCTTQVIPTNRLTVQLRLDASGVETFHQFFPGVENSSRVRMNDGDTVVRCGVRLPLILQPGNQIQKPHAKTSRTNRRY